VTVAIAYVTIITVVSRWVWPPIVPPPPRTKTPSALDQLIAVHNMMLSLFSVVMLGGTAYYVWQHYTNLPDMICNPGHELERTPILSWVYLFYLSKYVELLDTVFLVAKRKSLIFLHVYHHAATLVLVYYGVVQHSVSMWVAVILNCGVHMPMYYYYARASLKLSAPWWTPYLTAAQTIQFCINGSLLVYWGYLNWTEEARGGSCSGGWGSSVASLAVNGTFFLLFRAFARKKYADKKAKAN
jgi:fatty acid elongase 3